MDHKMHLTSGIMSIFINQITNKTAKMPHYNLHEVSSFQIKNSLDKIIRRRMCATLKRISRLFTLVEQELNLISCVLLESNANGSRDPGIISAIKTVHGRIGDRQGQS